MITVLSIAALPRLVNNTDLVRFLKTTLARPSFAACIEGERKALASLGLTYAL